MALDAPASEPLAPDPDDPRRLVGRGADLLAEGRADEAVEVLRHAVAAGADGAVDLLVRAYVVTRAWHACASWLGPLVEQGQLRHAGALGAALVQLGDEDRAEDALRRAVRAGDLAAASELGILLRDQGRLGEARQVLDRAAADDGQAAANLVWVLIESGDLTAAADAAERLADPARPDTLIALADVRAEQARDDDAEGLYRQARDLHAERVHTAYGGFLLTARGDVAGAEREFRAAAQRREAGWAATMGRFLFDDDRGEEARPYLERAAAESDREAARLLAELDGEDPSDD